MSQSNQEEQRRVMSVAELTGQIKEVLEGTFPAVWVAGEISNMSRPQSGHVYLTLKDDAAQIRGVIWRGTATRLRFDLEDGQQVVCQGEVDVYPPRGSYQLVIRQIEPQGLGALQLAFRQLHARLTAEGLFDVEHKKPLPRYPRRVAFVTSPTGAAIRDFLEVVRRRWQGAQVLIVPTRVQGDSAAAEIAAGIQQVNQLAEPPDVIVIGRGGGSLEDLWCFNEEPVVRAIFDSQVPIVSAVGHEIDVTLADLVADVRAATPTEAAELVVPSSEEIATGLTNFRQRLTSALHRRALLARARVDAIAQTRAFRRPLDMVHDLSLQLDELNNRHRRAIQHRLTRDGDRLAALAARLESLSPLAVLSRGYSVTQRTSDGRVVRDASMLSPGEQITTRLADGRVISRVE